MKIEDYKNVENIVANRTGFIVNSKNALVTTDEYVYLKTDQSQIRDIIATGYVRPKESETVKWYIGGPSLNFTDKKPVIEASIERVYHGRKGLVPISDLTAIYEYDESAGRYIDCLDKIKEEYNSENDNPLNKARR